MNAQVGWLQVVAWDAPIDQPLEVDFNLWRGRSKAMPAGLTVATGYLRAPGATTNALALTVGDGLELAGGTLSIRIPEASMRSLTPGLSYSLEVKFTADGSVRQLRGVVNTLDGLS